MSEIVDFTEEDEVKKNTCGVNHRIPISSKFYRDNYNYLRISKIILFQDCIQDHETYKNMSSENRTELLKKMEQSCYNFAVRKAKDETILPIWNLKDLGVDIDNFFVNIYEMCCFKITSNIDQRGEIKSNILDKIMSGEVDASNVAYLTSQEMRPDKYKDILLKIESQKNVKQTVNTSKLYKCPRCGKNETEIILMQTRSLDESNSAFAQCVSCGKRWQVG
jgi:DNA-directed RNA polymerase subunit M/transcription elongation factor TFIIS